MRQFFFFMFTRMLSSVLIYLGKLERAFQALFDWFLGTGLF